MTAIGKDRLNYRYANRGDHIDVAAPGVDIWTAVPGGKEGYHSGTSFAAPHVTGILALLPRESLKGNKNELLECARLGSLGEPGRDTVYGRGLLVVSLILYTAEREYGQRRRFIRSSRRAPLTPNPVDFLQRRRRPLRARRAPMPPPQAARAVQGRHKNRCLGRSCALSTTLRAAIRMGLMRPRAASRCSEIGMTVVREQSDRDIRLRLRGSVKCGRTGKAFASA